MSSSLYVVGCFPELAVINGTFAAVDGDGDGLVSPAELAAFVRLQITSLAAVLPSVRAVVAAAEHGVDGVVADAANCVLRDYDADGDGCLSPQEFAAWQYGEHVQSVRAKSQRYVPPPPLPLGHVVAPPPLPWTKPAPEVWSVQDFRSLSGLDKCSGVSLLQRLMQRSDAHGAVSVADFVETLKSLSESPPRCVATPFPPGHSTSLYWFAVPPYRLLLFSVLSRLCLYFLPL